MLLKTVPDNALGFFCLALHHGLLICPYYTTVEKGLIVAHFNVNVCKSFLNNFELSHFKTIQSSNYFYFIFHTLVALNLF